MLPIALVLALVLVGTSEKTYFVKPASSSCPKHDQPCLTLDEYASNQSEFFTSDSTFLFLNGTHTTRIVIHLENISRLQFEESDSRFHPEVDFSIKCSNVSGITIQGLVLRFTGRMNNTTLTFIKSIDILVTQVSFLGSNQTRAVLLDHSIAVFRNCTFRENRGVPNCGALLVQQRSQVFVLSNSVFIKNSAQQIGGAVCVNQSKFHITDSTFIGNSASQSGGVYASYSTIFTVGVQFVKNSADLGGAVGFRSADGKFSNTTVIGNSGTALFFNRSKINFNGTSILKENINTNVGGIGGAVTSEISVLSFSGTTNFEDNYASMEGGALVDFVMSTISFAGSTKFINNTADQKGGGAILLTVNSKLLLHGSVLFLSNNCTTCHGGAISVASASEIEIFDFVTFKNNSAQMGGAIYIRFSTITLNQGAKIETIGNHADWFGGGIFHLDSIESDQCEFTIHANYPQGLILFLLPDCFLSFRKFSFVNAHQYQIVSINDTAGEDGQFMYGGLIDKCRILDISEQILEFKLLYNVVFEYDILQIYPNTEYQGKYALSSEAFTLCICETNSSWIDCTGSLQISTVRGSMFNVSVVALSQGEAITAPVILAKIKKTARLELNQNSQQIEPNCSILSYNMYSTEITDQLVIFPDQTCRDTGLAVVTVNVTFEDCPVGFVFSGDQCTCEERLQKYTDQCIIGDDKNYISKKFNDRFWVGFSSNQKLGIGLILCNSCPPDYCKTDEVNVSVTSLNMQCAYNHSGLLCGSCATNYSHVFGDLVCQKCSNMSLLILIAFAVAGILLVAFLSILRLTVATGMINSIILYTNIIQAIFSTNTNVFTVFIAWMNLDLGFSTCFYNGMDAYAQTWLQFAFPLYVWFLISLIIITSRYSTLMTKLIGSNPIAVLATLLLMSYTKILKNIIDIYSSVQLEYPNVNITVWYKDASFIFLESYHLVLAVLSTIFVIICVFPYTIFLLLGYRIYHYSGRKYIRQIMMKLKPLLDSYYAPHEKHSRFWPGLLLLVRCGLFIVFTLDYIHGSNNSLVTVTITFIVLIVIAWLLSWFSIRVYRSFFVNAIEALVFLNLIVLSIMKSNGAESFELTFSLVGMVFAIMVVVVLYQLYFIYVAKMALWLKLVSFLHSKMRKLANNDNVNERTPLMNKPTNFVVRLREPVMEYLTD